MNILLVHNSSPQEYEVMKKSTHIIEMIFNNNGICYEKKSLDEILSNLVGLSVYDFVYIVDYGGIGERGGLQMILEEKRIPFSGPGATAHSLCKDKLMFKKICDVLGIITPKYKAWEEYSDFSDFVGLHFPLIIKPRVNGGSSLGLTKFDNEQGYRSGVDELLRYDQKGLVEEYHEGEDYIVAYIKYKGESIIKVGKALMNKDSDFSTRYNNDEPLFELMDDKNPLSVQLIDIVKSLSEFLDIAENFYVDFRISKKGVPFLLELGTMYGIMENSIIPAVLKSESITLENFVLEEIGYVPVTK